MWIVISKFSFTQSPEFPLGRHCRRWWHRGLSLPRVVKRQPQCRRGRPGRHCDNSGFLGFMLINCIFNQMICKISFVILCYIFLIYAFLYIIYLFIHLFRFIHLLLYYVYVTSNGMIFTCISLYMIMSMLLLATSTHFQWELILYCLHCPNLYKVFVLLLLLLLISL